MGIQKTPVDSSATLVTRHATSQSARRCRSVVKVRKDCTGSSSRSGGTATTCVVAPQSMPAASGLMRSNTDGDVRRGRRGRRGRDSAIGHLQRVEASGHREHENDQTPKRDHHRSGVTNDQNVTPRTTLLDGHDSRTSVGTASAPGCGQHPTSEAARMLASPPVSRPMSRGKRHMDRYTGVILIKNPRSRWRGQVSRTFQ